MEPWTLGPLTIYPFGVIMAVAALIGIGMTALAMRGKGLKPETASWFALLAVPLCYILARLGYCLFIVDQMMGNHDFGLIFRVREGGFLLWGAIVGGLLAALWTGRITNQKGGSVADSAVLAACFLIIVGRIACGLLFKDQGTGFDLEEWFAPEEEDFAYRVSLFRLEDFSFFERFPFSVKNYYGEWCWAVFMLEAVWTVVIAIVCGRNREEAPGGKTAKFVLMYACGQITLEAMLRGDVLHLPWLGFVRANQVLSAIAVVAVACVSIHRLAKEERAAAALRCFPQVIAAMLIVTAMEFAAFEKKISIIEWMPADVCHLIMGLACLWMGLAVGHVRKAAYALQK